MTRSTIQDPSKSSQTLLLIDGNNLFHRAYHALPPLTSKDGENNNAVFGFTNMLLKAINEINPDYIACAFDTAAPTFRHVEFEKYKAQRPAPPPDLYPQLPKVKSVLEALGVVFFEKAGYEADDLLASIACKFHETGTNIQVIIYSGDRDVLQMVDGFIKVQMPGWRLEQVTLYGAKEVEEKFGITPLQMVDYKSLIGDVSDNVPGIAGIGPKTASSLLQKYGTIEGIYENLAEIGETTRKKLEVGRELALAAKRLVELDRTVDLGFKMEDLKFEPRWESLRQELEMLGFRSIIGKLPQAEGKISAKEPDEKKSESNQLELI